MQTLEGTVEIDSGSVCMSILFVLFPFDDFVKSIVREVVSFLFPFPFLP